MGRYRHVADDWASYWSRCSSCGNKYHDSDGGCGCEEYYEEEEEEEEEGGTK